MTQPVNRKRLDRLRAYATYSSTFTISDARDLIAALDERDRVIGVCLQTLEKTLEHLEMIIRIQQPYGLPDETDAPVLAALEQAIDEAAEVLG